MTQGEVCPFLERTVGMEKGNSALLNQTIKLFKHTRSCSYATRARYLKSCRLFVAFLDERYKMKSLRNLQDKHLVAYLQHRQDEGLSDKTIKNDLAAIRYLHDLLPSAKYQLSTNAQLIDRYDLTLEKTVAVSGDRSWTQGEYEAMLSLLAQNATESPLALLTRDIMQLCRTMGLRVSEAVCMRRSQAESALRTGLYHVQGEAKNGLHRHVPLSPEARSLLVERLPSIHRGARLFIPQDAQAHKVVLSIERYLGSYREAVTSLEGVSRRLNAKGEVNPLTFHGLRYNYVQERMAAEQLKGYSWEAAAQIVTQEVGHGRIEVIRIYTNGK